MDFTRWFLGVGSLHIKIDIGELGFAFPLSAMGSIIVRCRLIVGGKWFVPVLFSFIVRVLIFGLVCCLFIINLTFPS